MREKNIILCLFCVIALIAAGDILPLRKFREPGDALDISIRQELDRAADIGAQWLIGRQSSDGSFGSKGSVAETALALLALKADTFPTNAAAKALSWLRREYAAQSATNTFAAAWGLAALSVYRAAAEPQHSGEEQRLRRILTIQSAGRTDRELAYEVLCSLSSDSISRPDELRQPVETDSEKTPFLRMWLNARRINREMDGQLFAPDGSRIDWRRLYARRIISTQRVSPQGGGFWPDDTGSGTLLTTALAVLICGEL